MNLIAALNANPSVLAEFKRRATPETTTSSLLAWLKTLPEMQAVTYWPSVEAIRPIRRTHGCPAKQGGPRAQRGVILYTVARKNRREAV